MNKKQLIEEVETEAKKYFVDASGCHDWTHVERVRALAKRIGRAESADMFVVEVAALLHDVSRGEEMRKGGMFCHAEHGAEEAKQIIVRLAANRSSSIVSRIASELSLIHI